jgi:hypothetical protein
MVPTLINDLLLVDQSVPIDRVAQVVHAQRQRRRCAPSAACR